MHTKYYVKLNSYASVHIFNMLEYTTGLKILVKNHERMQIFTQL